MLINNNQKVSTQNTTTRPVEDSIENVEKLLLKEGIVSETEESTTGSNDSTIKANNDVVADEAYNIDKLPFGDDIMPIPEDNGGKTEKTDFEKNRDEILDFLTEKLPSDNSQKDIFKNQMGMLLKQVVQGKLSPDEAHFQVMITAESFIGRNLNNEESGKLYEMIGKILKTEPIETTKPDPVEIKPIDFGIGEEKNKTANELRDKLYKSLEPYLKDGLNQEFIDTIDQAMKHNVFAINHGSKVPFVDVMALIKPYLKEDNPNVIGQTNSLLEKLYTVARPDDNTGGGGDPIVLRPIDFGLGSEGDKKANDIRLQVYGLLTPHLKGGLSNDVLKIVDGMLKAIANSGVNFFVDPAFSIVASLKGHLESDLSKDEFGKLSKSLSELRVVGRDDGNYPPETTKPESDQPTW